MRFFDLMKNFSHFIQGNFLYFYSKYFSGDHYGIYLNHQFTGLAAVSNPVLNWFFIFRFRGKIYGHKVPVQVLAG